MRQSERNREIKGLGKEERKKGETQMTLWERRRKKGRWIQRSTCFITTHYPHTRDHSSSFPGPTTCAMSALTRMRDTGTSVRTFRRLVPDQTIVHPGSTGSPSFLHLVVPRPRARITVTNVPAPGDTRRVSLFSSTEYITHRTRQPFVFSRIDSSLSLFFLTRVRSILVLRSGAEGRTY